MMGYAYAQPGWQTVSTNQAVRDMLQDMAEHDVMRLRGLPQSELYHYVYAHVGRYRFPQPLRLPEGL